MERLFLAILKGETPYSATPIFASEDEALIRAVGRAVGHRLGVDDRDKGPSLRLLDLANEEGEVDQ